MKNKAYLGYFMYISKPLLNYIFKIKEEKELKLITVENSFYIIDSYLKEKDEYTLSVEL